MVNDQKPYFSVGRKLVLVEVDDIIVGAVQKMRVAVFVGAEIFSFVAVMDEKAF